MALLAKQHEMFVRLCAPRKSITQVVSPKTVEVASKLSACFAAAVKALSLEAQLPLIALWCRRRVPLP